MKKILRILVATEIIIMVSGFIVWYYTRRFLPELLQAYMRQTATAKFYAQQWISLAIALVLFILLIIAWISIWRLSRNARLFYTLYWAICFPYTIISGPVVISGATMAFALAGYLTAGMILGILYFAKVNTSLIDQPSANN